MSALLLFTLPCGGQPNVLAGATLEAFDKFCQADLIGQWSKVITLKGQEIEGVEYFSHALAVQNQIVAKFSRLRNERRRQPTEQTLAVDPVDARSLCLDHGPLAVELLLHTPVGIADEC